MLALLRDASMAPGDALVNPPVDLLTRLTMATTVTDKLADWTDIREKYRNQQHLGLLLGNGASRAIWSRFGYDSLFNVACEPTRRSPLSPIDQRFFDEMETHNFEVVLSALATTKMVCGHLKKEFGDVDDRYQSIRESLIEAVRTVHVPFSRVKVDQKRWLGKILSQYRYVYTTNYDLLPYWASMEIKKDHTTKDFLWWQSFDSADCDERDEDGTFLIYLHGALHLYHDQHGRTRKKTFQPGADLLNQFDVSGEWIPLFVSEGTTKEKLRAIHGNEYLSFAYWKFMYHRGPLVVFGSALDESLDGHILNAMKHWKTYDRWRLGASFQKRRLAFAVYPKLPPQTIVEFKNRISNVLQDYEVEFFDSTTHPLADSRLVVQDAPDDMDGW